MEGRKGDNFISPKALVDSLSPTKASHEYPVQEVMQTIGHLVGEDSGYMYKAL